MRLDKFTQRGQEAILAAQELAQTYNHSQIEPEHLLLALLQPARRRRAAGRRRSWARSRRSCMAGSWRRALRGGPRCTAATPS